MCICIYRHVYACTHLVIDVYMSHLDIYAYMSRCVYAYMSRCVDAYTHLDI